MAPRKTLADLERARQGIPWVDDDDLDDVERKSPVGAAALSLFTWGGGQMYTYDRWRGAAYMTSMIAAIITLANVFPPAIAVLVVGASLASAVDAGRKARAVTRYASVRTQLSLTATADPAHYRLLAAAAAVDPGLAGAVPALGPVLAATPAPPGPPVTSGRHAGLIDRLRKLHALRAAGVISDHELRDRKVDVLEEVAPDSRDALDELLFELLPLVDQAVLDQQDIEFLKQLAGGK
jgi:hypothetical protein